MNTLDNSVIHLAYKDPSFFLINSSMCGGAFRWIFVEVIYCVQKKPLDLLEEAVSHTRWVLGTDIGFSARRVIIPDC